MLVVLRLEGPINPPRPPGPCCASADVDNRRKAQSASACKPTSEQNCFITPPWARVPHQGTRRGTSLYVSHSEDKRAASLFCSRILYPSTLAPHKTVLG